MEVLKGILDESKEYYEKEQKELDKEISKLPKGSIKKRKLGNKFYYYLQYREGDKILQDYLGKSEPKEIINKLKKRKALEKELKKVKDSLKLLSKVK
jgi:hypothetical protein